ncbi:chitin disaccharide deacetylase [Bacillus atrophaeus]|uniref:chitin disaccharide deacetylase n=1 Tax=Bacillus atrophaeus TaxID=1452 RepID=UPI00227FD834|nr:chitin disaccharide deacetylase [Bacillus atrophaeus]MCY8836793.1 chitin disaccharide deacetylase [Bacillus atrophaeus]MCY8973921.1 chitin disaccharide deacetylase [Bacillus atrophaeus]MEC5220829.1 chitin disaccharide deacetylase [Bacillus atrophaeus]MED4580267.1 chitin disaccharide deacetylase [Bacillus atrophaeus]MED4721517.1 chitin disaccharide deacetylase [Bacillus atrophaeus]
MKSLIINADDFGFSRGVNLGIIDAFQRGVLTSTTLMTNMLEMEHAVLLARGNHELGVGVHLTLTAGRPLLSGLQTVTDEDGNFRKLSYYQGFFDIDLDEVYQEWRAQIEKALSCGLHPTHIDSHHHIHTYGNLPEVFVKLAKEYDLPCRKVNDHHPSLWKNVRSNDAFELKVDRLKDLSSFLDLHEDAEVIEVMCHPAYVDKLLLEKSSFHYPRVYELSLLTDPLLKAAFIQCSDIRLISYAGL